jgi:hypothetical protein
MRRARRSRGDALWGENATGFREAPLRRTGAIASFAASALLLDDAGVHPTLLERR